MHGKTSNSNLTMRDLADKQRVAGLNHQRSMTSSDRDDSVALHVVFCILALNSRCFVNTFTYSCKLYHVCISVCCVNTFTYTCKLHHVCLSVYCMECRGGAQWIIQTKWVIQTLCVNPLPTGVWDK